MDGWGLHTTTMKYFTLSLPQRTTILWEFLTSSASVRDISYMGKQCINEYTYT